MKKLIYIMNPMCGWCFGNSQNMQNLSQEFGEKIEIEYIVGEMWTGINAPKGSKGLGDFVSQDAINLKNTTGLSPSQNFFDLAYDESYTFDSTFPSLAITYVKRTAKTKLSAFIKKVLDAQFLDGKKLTAVETYESIFKELDLDFNDFLKEWESTQNKEELNKNFKKARELASSYPTLLLEDGENHTVLNRGYFSYDTMKVTLNTLLD